jgi:acetyl esterase/lipase
MFEKRIVYSVPGMERIAPRANLVYKSAAGKSLLADLYLPPDATAPAPIVIFIHGAIPEGIGIEAKDGGAFVSWGQLIAASGMAGVTFNHRMRWANGFASGSVAEAAEDLDGLIRFLRGQAPALGIDPGRICLLAFSAGGPMLAAPIREQASHLRCLAGFYAYLGEPLPGSADAGRYCALDALSGSGRVPPIFIAKAGKDLAPMNDAIDRFVTRAHEVGASVELAAHPEGLHGFDVLNDDDISRAIIRGCVEFIAHHLREQG